MEQGRGGGVSIPGTSGKGPPSAECRGSELTLGLFHHLHLQQSHFEAVKAPSLEVLQRGAQVPLI